MTKQAMIMAAGLGSRLGELTSNKPKALINYKGKPLLKHVVDKLYRYGYREIIVNVHHFAQMVVDYLDQLEYDDLNIIISDERKKLLDTGGGIKKASAHFDDRPVLIHNVDILSNIDLDVFMNYHQITHGSVTLAVKDRKTSRSLLRNKNNILCGWRNNETGEEIISRPDIELKPIAFSAIYIVEKNFIQSLPSEEIFPIMPEILNYSRTSNVNLFEHSADEWKDMGKKDQFNESAS
jgi:NDP-sugar pyrophosphorylase family protein